MSYGNSVNILHVVIIFQIQIINSANHYSMLIITVFIQLREQFSNRFSMFIINHQLREFYIMYNSQIFRNDFVGNHYHLITFQLKLLSAIKFPLTISYSNCCSSIPVNLSNCCRKPSVLQQCPAGTILCNMETAKAAQVN